MSKKPSSNPFQIRLLCLPVRFIIVLYLVQESELVASGFRFLNQASTRLGGATHVDAELSDHLVEKWKQQCKNVSRFIELDANNNYETH